MKFEDLIKQTNEKAEDEESDIMYITILSIDYTIIGSESYTGIDPNGVPLTLCKLFLCFNDEQNSTECEILIKQEDLEKVLKENDERNSEQRAILQRSV